MPLQQICHTYCICSNQECCICTLVWVWTCVVNYFLFCQWKCLKPSNKLIANVIWLIQLKYISTHHTAYTPCPRKKQATLFFAITSPFVEIFLQFWSILFRNNSRMARYSTYSEMFIYVVIKRIETVSYTKCTKSAVIRHKTLEISG